jgi:hypothetical protein
VKATTSSLKDLARQYSVTTRMLKKWLEPYPEINIKFKQRVLCPKQVALIYEKLGEP